LAQAMRNTPNTQHGEKHGDYLRRHEPLSEGLNQHADPFVSLGILELQLPGHAGQLAGRFIPGYAVHQPGKNIQCSPLPPRRCMRIELQRDPHILLEGKSEARGSNGDYSHHLAVGPHGPADDVGAAAEPVLPHTVADNHHTRTAGSLIGLLEPAADDRRNSEYAEHVGRYQRTGVSLGPVLGARQIDGDPIKRGQFLESRLPLAPIKEIVHRDRAAGYGHRTRCGILEPFPDRQVGQLFGLVERQPANDRPVDDAESGRREPDTHGKGKHGDDGNRGVVAEHADPVTQILQEIAHQ